MRRAAVRSGREGSAAGFSMPALLAMLAIMALALLLAMPSWRYLARDDKEQELIFRGRQISDAIARFQRKNGNALPASLDQLVQGKYLRKAYQDPLTKDGKWRILRPGEAGPIRPVSPPGGTSPSSAAPSATPSPAPVFGAGSGSPSGPVGGVASLSTEQGYRTVNGSQLYSRWVFAPNVPFILGGQSPGAGAPGVPNQVPVPGRLRAPDLDLPRMSR